MDFRVFLKRRKVQKYGFGSSLSRFAWLLSLCLIGSVSPCLSVSAAPTSSEASKTNTVHKASSASKSSTASKTSSASKTSTGAKKKTAKSFKGLQYVQNTESFGLFEVWFSPSAIRVSSTSNRYILATSAPDWKVRVWRPDRKEACECTLDQFMKEDQFFTNRLSYASDLRQPLSMKKAVNRGDKLLVYKYPAIEVVSGAGLFMSDRLDESGLKAGEKLYPELICFDVGDLPGLKVLYKLFNIAPQPGLPISAFVTKASGRQGSLINCQFRNREFSFDQSAVAIPAGYKRVPLHKRLFFTNSQGDALSEFYEGGL